MIKSLVFDLGNVLLFFDHELIKCNLARICQRSYAEVDQFLFGSGLEWRTQEGKISTAQFSHLINGFSRRMISEEELYLNVSDIFKPNHEMIEVLKKAKMENYRLLMLSNTNEMHFRFIKKNYPELIELFDHLILSYEFGSCKPDKRIFQEAVNHAKAKPEEMFYTDDIESYVIAASKLGMNGTIYTNTTSYLEALRSINVHL